MQTSAKIQEHNGYSKGRKIDSASLKKGAPGSMLKTFFIDELKDIYWAEQHLVKAIPKMHKAATTTQLQEGFAKHLEQTKEHVMRLEKVFEMLGQKPQAVKCDAMEGIVKEGEGIIDDTEKDSMTRDVALIIAAQKVEHYEIATYGSLVELAITMGLDDVAEILATTLQEEKDTDVHLTVIAENHINWDAAVEGNGSSQN